MASSVGRATRRRRGPRQQGSLEPLPVRRLCSVPDQQCDSSTALASPHLWDGWDSSRAGLWSRGSWGEPQSLSPENSPCPGGAVPLPSPAEERMLSGVAAAPPAPLTSLYDLQGLLPRRLLRPLVGRPDNWGPSRAWQARPPLVVASVEGARDHWMQSPLLPGSPGSALTSCQQSAWPGRPRGGPGWALGGPDSPDVGLGVGGGGGEQPSR